MIFGVDPATATTPQATSASALGGLDSDAFLQLLVAQLKYQNPMSPTDHSAMLEQTATFSQVEMMQSIQTAQAELKGLQEVALASGMVGKHVVAHSPTGSVEGEVDSVRFTADGPQLVIGFEEVPLTAVLEVHDEPAG